MESRDRDARALVVGFLRIRLSIIRQPRGDTNPYQDAATYGSRPARPTDSHADTRPNSDPAA
jgi:hypothetical protein